MKYLLKINEYVENDAMVRFYLNKVIGFLKALSIQHIFKNQSEIELSKKTSYKVILYNLEIKFTNEKKIMDYLIKTQNDMLDVGYYFSYRLYKSHGLKFKPNAKVLDLGEIDNTKEYITLYLYAKKIYIQRVKVPEFIYHSTDAEHIDSIRENGLKCSKLKNFNATDLEYPPMVFCSTKDDVWWGSYSVKISTKGLPNNWWKDLNLPHRTELIMTNQDIPKEFIVGIYKKEKLTENVQIDELVLYHGTNNKFDVFDDIKPIFFVDDLVVSKTYGDYIIKAKLDINNPLVLDFDGNSTYYFFDKWYLPSDLANKIKEISDDIKNNYSLDEDLQEYLEYLDFCFNCGDMDGIIMKNISDSYDMFSKNKSATNYVVFDKSQIKKI